MQWYQYSPATKEYTHPVKCQKHPLNDEYLIPPSATPHKPPDAGDEQVAVFSDNQWHIEEDHRGTTVYSQVDKTPMKIVEIGPIPDGYTTIKPLPHEYISFYQNNGYARKERIKQQTLRHLKKEQTRINQFVKEQMP